MDIQSYVNIAKLVHDLPPRFGSVFKVFFQPLNITHVSEAGQVNPSCLHLLHLLQPIFRLLFQLFRIVEQFLHLFGRVGVGYAAFGRCPLLSAVARLTGCGAGLGISSGASTLVLGLTVTVSL
jgi:hypothetical protein